MNRHTEIETLKAQLMQAQSELSEMRAEKADLDLRVEVEKRGGTDHEAIAALVSKYTRRNNDGQLVAVDEAGEFRFGNGPGSYMPVGELLDELSRKHACFFSGKDKATAAPHGITGNPFRPGADFNMTAQMVLMRTDPILAEDMAAEAGVSLRRNG